MNNIKHIYWFAYFGESSPSVRYRAIFPLAYYYKKDKIGNNVAVPGYSLLKIIPFLVAYISALCFRKRKSIIVIQRVQTNFIYARLLKFLLFVRRKNTIYDIDDADYINGNTKQIEYFATHCDKISAGSKALKKHFKTLNPKTAYITSPIIDLNIYKFNKNKLFTIGWVGGLSWGHKESLWEYLFNVVVELDFPVKLMLLGIDLEADKQEIKEFMKPHKHITLDIVEEINWINEKKIQDQIVQFDIGIATLSDTPYHIAKSGIKTKQYMCCGIPVVSSDLPENNNFVQDGKNGFLCDTAADFKARITQFNAMGPDEYQRFAINARNSIALFNHKKYLKDLQDLVKM